MVKPDQTQAYDDMMCQRAPNAHIIDWYYASGWQRAQKYLATWQRGRAFQ